MKILVLLLTCSGLVFAQCPDGFAHSVAIGGNSVAGVLLQKYGGVEGREIRLYSAGHLVWKGTAARDGSFRIPDLAPGNYEIKVSRWGHSSIRIDPSLDRKFAFGNQIPAWNVSIGPHACLAWGFEMD